MSVEEKDLDKQDDLENTTPEENSSEETVLEEENSQEGDAPETKSPISFRKKSMSLRTG